MSSLLLRFADGTVFFDGLILCLVAQLLLSVTRARRVRSVLVCLVLVGMLLVLVSSTPLPVWVYVLWLIACGGGLFVNRPFRFAPRMRMAVVAVLLLLTVILSLSEMKFRAAPTIMIHKESTIYILGDSISEGMGERYVYWPELLSQETSIEVVNLAKAGSTVESAIKLASGIVEPGSLVIIEIGGNDLLGDTDASDFYEYLDQLVGSLVTKHQILMLELPLYPFQNAFGAAQRRITQKYDIHMLPKKEFARVFGVENSTTDGLHLSQAGHGAMAEVIGNVITVVD